MGHHALAFQHALTTMSIFPQFTSIVARRQLGVSAEQASGNGCDVHPSRLPGFQEVFRSLLQ